SAAAFATMSVPRLPLAPGLFSTTNALAGYFCCKPSATRRATMSGVDPGPNGTTIRTVFGGQSCAANPAIKTGSSKSPAMTRFAIRYNVAQVIGDVPGAAWLALIAAILYCGGDTAMSVPWA